MFSLLTHFFDRRLTKFRAAHVPTADVAGPVLELVVVGDAAFQGDGVELGAQGDLREGLGSPPTRCRMASVVRVRALTLEMPAT
jgi:hypothetical protein